MREALGTAVAAVGIGPPGAQVVCLVVDGRRSAWRSPTGRCAPRSRAAAAARWPPSSMGHLPVDRRHQSKIDRTDLAAAADRFLAGR